MFVRPLLIALSFALVSSIAGAAQASIVSDWNAVALEEVRKSKSLRNGPPIVARALAIVHTCTYDAWAQYDDVAVGVTVGGRYRQPRSAHTDANKHVAVSFAAYRCLRNLYPDAASTVRLDAALTAAVSAFGYGLAHVGNMTADNPAGVGNLAAQAVIDHRANDGANQYGDGSCQPLTSAGRVCPTVPPQQYTPAPCVSATYPRPTPANPAATVTLNQLGDAPPEIQPIPCVGAGGVQGGPYADYDDLATAYTHYVPRNPLMGFCNPIEPVCPRPDPFIPIGTPYPNIHDLDHWQPLIFSSGAKQTFVSPYMFRVTPFALTSADQFDHLRHLQPRILQNPRQYKKAADEVLQASAGLTDDEKLVVEYWADGPESELPPGHWGLFAQFVSDRDSHSIDQDVKMFFAMHNASFDAGIVAWHLKRKFDGVRPITAIRHLYNGKKVLAYGGPGRPVELIDGEKWMPYNPGTNLTPPFPGYISGHSTFSAASAVVLRAFTGSDQFGYSTLIPQYFFNRVETPGIPTNPNGATITYDTFSDAADAAALSRLLGGIHFSEDNRTGLKIGRLIGRQAWQKAKWYFTGGADRRNGRND